MHVIYLRWDDSAGPLCAVSPEVDEIHVWVITMPSNEACLASFACTLSPDERVRAKRFRVSEPRQQYVFGRGVLRQLLGACLNLAPAGLLFGYGARGKPFLRQSPAPGGLCFNLSHSGRLVAIALAQGRELGVDVELIGRIGDWSARAERIFSKRELSELGALPRSQQQAAFYESWTAKEAYFKATGEGLTDALPEIEVTLTPGQEPRLLGLPAGPEAAGRWTIHRIPLPPGFAGALVFNQRLVVGVPTDNAAQRTAAWGDCGKKFPTRRPGRTRSTANCVI